MGPGSIVVVIKHPVLNSNVIWMPVMDENTPYMIREILDPHVMIDNVAGAYLEEGIVGWDNDNIQEEIEEMMLQPMVEEI